MIFFTASTCIYLRLVILKKIEIEGKKYFFAMSHYHARYKSEEISPGDGEFGDETNDDD